MNEIEEIIRRLPELERVGEIWEIADRRVEAGDAAFVADLGIASHQAAEADWRVWQFGSVLDHALRLLASTPGRANVEQVVRLDAETGGQDATTSGQGRARYLASVLSSNQSPGDLAVLFDGDATDASEELRACLTHELVLRGEEVAQLPGISAWATSPHWQDHPLRWLPLSRSAAERNPGLPRYNAHGASASLPFGPSDQPDTQLPGTTSLVASEVMTPARETAMTRAVAKWAEASNGRAEARVFDVDAPIESPRDLLGGLGLACLEGLGQRPGLSVAPCPVARAWQILFAAASMGGAYPSGVHGAYGRLAAWQSLAGMAGAAEDAPFDEVERLVNACTWYTFETRTGWFEQVAWDIGLVATEPGARRLAVLAATDTD
ncbi:DUF6183 family protein [Spirillospora sp. NPDC048911]|uniref:DUF6183 family protein n=1 Tax=Spirillospora sp. NPDC048911 TaxID=3364527 RepID=UPI0037134672